MSEPESKKSSTPSESASAGVVYPSTPLVTLPFESTSTGRSPRSPSALVSKTLSVNPASVTSKHPSPSLSRSNLLIKPSLSVSRSPSSVSRIPSLSSSKSTEFSIPSPSKSEFTFREPLADTIESWQAKVGVFITALYKNPLKDEETLFT